MITEDGCLFVGPGEGVSLRGTAQAPILLKASSDETGSLAAVFEQVTPSRTGPPLHVHDEAAEMFYVLEGNFIFAVGAERIEAPKGTFAFVPKGVAHTYFNRGDREGRLLFWFAPAARMAEYFTALSQLPPGGPLDRETLVAIARQHGVRIVGDPLEDNP